MHEHAVLFIQVLKSYKLAGTSATAVKSIEFARRGRYAQSKALFDSLTTSKIAREVTTGPVARYPASHCMMIENLNVSV